MRELFNSSVTSAQKVILVSAFSAIYLIFRSMPTFPILGIGSFRLSDILPLTYSILLGPSLAVLSIIVGTSLSLFTTAPPIFFGLDFLPASVNAVVVSEILRRRKPLPIIVFLALAALFSLSPSGVVLVFGGIPLLWLHAVAFTALVSPLAAEARAWFETSSRIKLLSNFAIVGFIGTMAQHLAGCLLTASFYSQMISQKGIQAYWGAVFLLYPLERALITASSAILGAAIHKAVKRTGLSQVLNPFQDSVFTKG
ncbi:MAG: hypothetical protein QW390_00025 [Candidatus Bathyarchaeia archaeon]